MAMISDRLKAVIGSSSDRAVKFYQRNCNAIEIPDSSRVYSRLIK